jgi:hypothetical protein
MTRLLRLLAIFPLLAVVLGACQFGPQQPRPVPSVRQIGSDLKCQTGDHGYEVVLGWGFCYPGSWQYNLKSQSSEVPIQVVDLIFDITNVPAVNGTPLPACPSPPPPSPPAGQPQRCDQHAGEFGVMIVSTFTRAGAPNLPAWVQANVNKPIPDLNPMAWGNAVEAGTLSDGRFIALTPQHVVIVVLHSGNLDLQSAISSRLSSWRFTV